MSRIARNIGWLFASQVTTWAISIVLLIVIPRLLTDSEFGRTQLASTFVSFFALAASLGTGTFIIKSTARDHRSMAPYVANALMMKLALIVVLSVAAISSAIGIGYDRELVVLVSICCISMFGTVMNETVVAGLQGRQEMRGPAAWAAVEEYVSAGLAITVLVITHDLKWYLLAYASANFIPLTANFIRVWPELRGHFRPDLRMWRTLVVGGAPFLLWTALQVVFGKIDIPLLQSLSGSAEVGWYSLAYSWVGLPVFFATIVSAAFFPSLSEHGATLSTSFVRLGNQAIRIVMFVGLPAAAGIAIVADDVFTLLHYSTEYRNAIPLMRILAFHIPIVGMDILLGLMLMAADRQRRWIVVGLVAAALNPLMNLVAIPVTNHLFDNGAIGASIVTVATELIIMIGAIRLRPAGILDRYTVGFIARCLLATAAMLPLELLLDDSLLAVQIAVGIAVYVGASVALRTLSFSRWRDDFLPRHELAVAADEASETPSEQGSGWPATTLTWQAPTAIGDQWPPPMLPPLALSSDTDDEPAASEPPGRRLELIRVSPPAGRPAPRARTTVNRSRSRKT